MKKIEISFGEAMKFVVGFLVAYVIIGATLSSFLPAGISFAIALPIATFLSSLLKYVDIDAEYI